MELRKLIEARKDQIGFDKVFSDKDLLQINWNLPMLREAVKVIRNYKNKRVLIYGDYDVDGVTGTTILVKGLSYLGYRVDYVIPLREDGYGLKPKTLTRAVKRMGCTPDLLITTDCGTNSRELVEQISHKIKVIVTDHHLPGNESEVSKCIIINPHLASPAMTTDMSGALVAYNLVAALCEAEGYSATQLRRLMHLAAISILSDSIKLTPLNRAIVNMTIKDIQRGLVLESIKGLLKRLKIDPLNVKAETLSYSIIPLLNASGRMGDPELAVQILLSDDKEIEETAPKLIKLNDKRKTVQENTLNSLGHSGTRTTPYVTTVPYEARGVTGILASKIEEEVGVPVFVLADDGSGSFTGSGRSSNTNLINVLESTKAHDLCLNYGGHEKACGLSLTKDNFEEFKRLLETYEGKQVVSESKYIELDMDSVTVQDVEEIENLAPFGNGNPEMLFKMILKEPVSADVIGENRDTIKFKHGKVSFIKFKERDVNGQLRKLSFARNEPVEIIYRLVINRYKGTTNIQGIITKVRSL